MNRDELLGLLRASHPKAVSYVLRVLREQGGNVQKAAKELDLGTRTLYRQRDRIPALQVGFERYAQGREGSSRAGVEARLSKVAKRA